MANLISADSLIINGSIVDKIFKGIAEVWTPPLVMGTIQVISSSAAGSQTASCTVPAPANIVAGNMLFAVFCCDTTGVTKFSASTGWTLYNSFNYSSGNNNGLMGLYYKIATSSEPESYIFTNTTALKAQSIGIMQMAGVSSVTPFIGTSTTYNGTTAAPPFPSITLPSAGGILLISCQGEKYNGNVSNIFNPPDGYTLGIASTSQYNQYTEMDSESVFASISASSTIPAGVVAPGSGVFNLSAPTGLMVIGLNPA